MNNPWKNLVGRKVVVKQQFRLNAKDQDERLLADEWELTVRKQNGGRILVESDFCGPIEIPIGEVIRIIESDEEKEIRLTFEKALLIMQRILCSAASCNAYSWSDEFCRKELCLAFSGWGYYEKKEEYYDQKFWENVCKLPNDLKELLGFKHYQKEFDPKMLIPLWIVEALPKGVQLKAVCINGNDAIVSKDMIDKDERCGCVAYMI